ncbi:MAG: glycosyltransferase [Flavobacteriaceae bacterium]|nr:glycosyltransferase [Flavobacteriaceae bacterium]
MKPKTQNLKPKILVAPLNWGIGHATRCIPIINELLKQGFTPILASDGDALLLLQKEFPNLKSYELPAYQIQYSKNAVFLKLKLFFQIPKVLRQLKKEEQIISQIIEKETINGIISDNRFGVYSTKIKTVYITHQIQVLSGFTTFFTTKIHQKIINKFDACWVPDIKNANLSGNLSNTKKLKTQIKFLGILSRFKKKNIKKVLPKYDILALLSGPEPQRTILEKLLINEFKTSTKKILFVRGVISEKEQITNTKHVTYKNYLLQAELEKAIKESKLVIARSGYSTIMDLAVLQKKAFFIPTPRQNEQEYLAKHLKHLKIAPFSSQKDFTVLKLKGLKNYTGFTSEYTKNSISFDIFTLSKSS